MVMQGVPNRPQAMRRRRRQLLALGWALIAAGVLFGGLPGFVATAFCGSQGASCGGTPLLLLVVGLAAIIGGVAGIIAARKYE